MNGITIVVPGLLFAALLATGCATGGSTATGVSRETPGGGSLPTMAVPARDVAPNPGAEPSSVTDTSAVLRVSGGQSLELNRSGRLTIPEAGGRSTTVYYSPGGGVTIREPGMGRTTQVMPENGGGLRIRTPDNQHFIVSPNGRVRTLGRRSGGTFVTTSRDGTTATIWGRGGRTYTVPIPQR